MTNPFVVATGLYSAEKVEFDARYDVTNWYTQLESTTFPTAWFPLSTEEAEAMIAAYRTEVLNHDPSDEADHHRSVIENVVKRIDEQIAARGFEEFFVRLSSRSPKDSCMDGSMTEFVPRVEAELDKLAADAAIPLDDNAVMISVIRASTALLKVRRGSEAMALLLRSERVYQDLGRSLRCREELGSWNMHVILRGWAELDPVWEFRGVVADRRLVAVSQYSELFAVPGLTPDVAMRCLTSIIDFFEAEVAVRLPEELRFAVVDFVVDPASHTVRLIELNPFGPTSGLKLIDWSANRRFLQGGVDLYGDLDDWEAQHHTLPMEDNPECVGSVTSGGVVLKFLTEAVDGVATGFLDWGLPQEERALIQECVERVAARHGRAPGEEEEDEMTQGRGCVLL